MLKPNDSSLPVARVLTWNPLRWAWVDAPDDFETIAGKVVRGAPVQRQWSVGNSKSVRPGEDVYLVRVGVEPKGLIATGVVIEGSHERPHWDPLLRAQGKTVQSVGMSFTRMAATRSDVLIPLDALRLGAPHTTWTPQASGIRVKSADLEWLKGALDDVEVPLPEELLSPGLLPEGARRMIQVIAYERSRAARQACLDHYGLRCQACGLALEQRYGEVAADLIQVHHLVPLSSIGDAYRVDPVRDLVPVCPNCHAVMHRREPPYTLEELKDFLAKREAGTPVISPLGTLA